MISMINGIEIGICCWVTHVSDHPSHCFYPDYPTQYSHSHHHHHNHHQNSEDQNHDDIIIGWRTASSSDFLEKRRETSTRWLVGAPCRSGRYHHLHHHHHRHQHHHNHYQIIYTRVTAEHSGKYTCSAGHNKVNKSVEVRLATIIIVNMMMSLG